MVHGFGRLGFMGLDGIGWVDLIHDHRHSSEAGSSVIPGHLN